MGMERLTLEALSVASFAAQLDALPRETRATVTATEHGTPWATVTISPMTGTARSVMPNYLGMSAVGDSRKVGNRGVTLDLPGDDNTHALRVVIERARRLARQ